MNFIKSDPTLAVGDFVLSLYHKGELIFKVNKITRRFLTANDLKSYVYAGGQVGDEYTPYITIESVANLSIFTNTEKKFRKTNKGLDASWVKKLTPELMKKHMRRISNIMYELWS